MTIICNKNEAGALERGCNQTSESCRCMSCPIYQLCRAKQGTIEKYIEVKKEEEYEPSER